MTWLNIASKFAETHSDPTPRAMVFILCVHVTKLRYFAGPNCRTLKTWFFRSFLPPSCLFRNSQPHPSTCLVSKTLMHVQTIVLLWEQAVMTNLAQHEMWLDTIWNLCRLCKTPWMVIMQGSLSSHVQCKTAAVSSPQCLCNYVCCIVLCSSAL